MLGIFCEDVEKNYLADIFSEIYKDKIYESFMKKDMTILEVGGNVGIATLYFSQFAKKIYVMEPSKYHLNCLRQTVDFNQLKNVVIIPEALDDNDGRKIFYHYDGNTTMFSLKQATNTPAGEVVNCICVSTLFKKYDIDHVDFMKLDVEGSEIDILGGESFREKADKIKSLVVEYHTRCGYPPEKLEDLLSSLGYKWQKSITGLHYHAKKSD